VEERTFSGGELRLAEFHDVDGDLFFGGTCIESKSSLNVLVETTEAPAGTQPPKANSSALEPGSSSTAISLQPLLSTSPKISEEKWPWLETSSFQDDKRKRAGNNEQTRASTPKHTSTASTGYPPSVPRQTEHVGLEEPTHITPHKGERRGLNQFDPEKCPYKTRFVPEIPSANSDGI
jgi:hypothetical protein